MCEKAEREALERDIDECETRIAAAVGGVFTRLQNLYKKRAAITQGEGSEPVGWQYRYRQVSVSTREPEWSNWTYARTEAAARHHARAMAEEHEVRPLYASPPPLPAGSADPRVREASQGLVEAADICRELYQANFPSASPSELLLLVEAERLIRSRASDRSAEC